MKIKIVIFFIISTFLLIITYPKVDNSLEYFEATNINFFKVEIQGAIVYPGTYELINPITLEELIYMAGGLRDDADSKNIVFSKIINKSENISIPVIEDSTDLRININTSSFNDLLRIPFINELKAQQIVEYRKKYGGYTKYDELLEIKGIGQATLEKIIPYIRLY